MVDNASAYGPSIIDSCGYNHSCGYTQPSTANIVGYRLDDDFDLGNSTRLLTTIQLSFHGWRHGSTNRGS